MLQLEVIHLMGGGGILGLSAGMGAGAHTGKLKGEAVHIPTLPSPLRPSVCLLCLYNPARLPSLAQVTDGSEGWDPPSHALFFTCILTFSPFHRCCFAVHIHSGGATAEGSYGQPCLTRERPGSCLKLGVPLPLPEDRVLREEQMGW